MFLKSETKWHLCCKKKCSASIQQVNKWVELIDFVSPHHPHPHEHASWDASGKSDLIHGTLVTQKLLPSIWQCNTCNSFEHGKCITTNMCIRKLSPIHRTFRVGFGSRNGRILLKDVNCVMIWYTIHTHYFALGTRYLRSRNPLAQHGPIWDPGHIFGRVPKCLPIKILLVVHGLVVEPTQLKKYTPQLDHFPRDRRFCKNKNVWNHLARSDWSNILVCSEERHQAVSHKWSMEWVDEKSLKKKTKTFRKSRRPGRSTDSPQIIQNFLKEERSFNLHIYSSTKLRSAIYLGRVVEWGTHKMIRQKGFKRPGSSFVAKLHK